MAHHVIRNGYARLVGRLNRFPQGAPPSTLLYRIMEVLFSERDAELAALLPIRPFTAARAARIWKMDETAARRVLDDLCQRAILVDMEQKGRTHYVFPPPMAGFFEFSMMRVRRDLDQKMLAVLYYQYLNKQDDFIRELFTNGPTQIGRVFVNEAALPDNEPILVLDYERATHIIRSASHRGVSLCYCRHKMSHLGRACDAPVEICMTFNVVGASLIKAGHAREADVNECLDLLDQARGHNLVQFGENVRREVNFVCHCCSCCCEAMLAARKFALLNPIHTTNFLPRVRSDLCSGCGQCVEVCPVEAVSLAPAVDPERPDRQAARVDESFCLGCGLCVRACTGDAISLIPRPGRVLTPLNTYHRSIAMAIERGCLPDVIFDNRVLWSHRALAVVLGVILRLPPIKQALANHQLKSRYLETILLRLGK